MISKSISFNPYYEPILLSEYLELISYNGKFDVRLARDISELPSRLSVLVFRPLTASTPFQSSRIFIFNLFHLTNVALATKLELRYDENVNVGKLLLPKGQNRTFTVKNLTARSITA